MTPHGRNDVTRSVHDHSVGRYLDAIGTTIDPDFESEADRALLDRFALDVVGRTRGPRWTSGADRGVWQPASPSSASTTKCVGHRCSRTRRPTRHS